MAKGRYRTLSGSELILTENQATAYSKVQSLDYLGEFESMNDNGKPPKVTKVSDLNIPKGTAQITNLELSKVELQQELTTEMSETQS